MRNHVFIAILAVTPLAGCFPTAPINAVPCLSLTPRTDALRAGLRAHPNTPEAVGGPAADLVLGVEAVCRK